jgi:hypothetical protein
MQIPAQPVDVLIKAPLPNVDISENDLHEAKFSFSQKGLSVGFRAEDPYPVAASWVEIAILSGTFIAGAAANHYAEKLFDAIDVFIKKKFGEFNLTISKGKKSTCRDVPRGNRPEAIRHIQEAIEELEKSDKG